ncbi:2OG-Fe(II) oxygenase [Streptomyces noursei]|uniref:2OG-Fe(II) oxygenase n=1 Tax=Streptomyces noursei TaxID=1971 RepID=UPI001E4E84DC|nr:2OG-Fe(II) oxygenase [Streptomyces noursei]MCZ1018736.1 2OG-Fe(II) oxygenase [Streptomyces noursei]
MDEYGSALTPRLLTPGQCRELIALYDEEERFRSTIDMARYRFGSGQYRYFADPLPELVADLRAAFYPHLLPVARDWAARLGRPVPWPDTLADWLARCREAGQARPAQILLRYGPGDWNALHRDVFGEAVFPLQVVIGLDVPGTDYTGGEFLMTEQRPRAQSRGSATTLPQGHGLVFTTRDRPVRSRRGWSAGPMRHGVSTVRSGRRHTLGLVFHDAS